MFVIVALLFLFSPSVFIAGGHRCKFLKGLNAALLIHPAAYN